jgi:hypothetical protein
LDSLGAGGGVGPEAVAVIGLAACVSGHCDTPSHVSLIWDSIRNRFVGKQKGLAGSRYGAESEAAD